MKVSNVWLVTMNGVVCSVWSTAEKAVKEIRNLSGDKKSDLYPITDSLIGLRGVGHYRAKKVVVDRTGLR